MNSCNTDRFLATTVVYGLSTLNPKAFTILASIGKILLGLSRVLLCDMFNRLYSDVIHSMSGQVEMPSDESGCEFLDRRAMTR